MATCRAALTQALAAFKAIAPGDDLPIDELTTGLTEIGNLLLDLHEARGPMIDVDATADYTPGEDQRVRIQAGDTISVTLPNSIALNDGYDPYDYGFIAQNQTPAQGSAVAADGIAWRQPRDGTRIEIVGTTQALYLYRADLNAWMSTTGLGVDDELPINNRLTSAFTAMLAERLVDQWPGSFEPSPGLMRRAARGRMALMLQTGRARDGVIPDYL
ncbi:MAG TPA: hypothetical protein VII73_07435 [Caulobacteraceae bacterium]